MGPLCVPDGDKGFGKGRRWGRRAGWDGCRSSHTLRHHASHSWRLPRARQDAVLRRRRAPRLCAALPCALCAGQAKAPRRSGRTRLDPCNSTQWLRLLRGIATHPRIQSAHLQTRLSSRGSFFNDRAPPNYQNQSCARLKEARSLARFAHPSSAEVLAGDQRASLMGLPISCFCA